MSQRIKYCRSSWDLHISGFLTNSYRFDHRKWPLISNIILCWWSSKYLHTESWQFPIAFNKGQRQVRFIQPDSKYWYLSWHAWPLFSTTPICNKQDVSAHNVVDDPLPASITGTQSPSGCKLCMYVRTVICYRIIRAHAPALLLDISCCAQSLWWSITHG